jgi:hypothetical protein
MKKMSFSGGWLGFFFGQKEPRHGRGPLKRFLRLL